MSLNREIEMYKSIVIKWQQSVLVDEIVASLDDLNYQSIAAIYELLLQFCLYGDSLPGQEEVKCFEALIKLKKHCI